MRTKSHAYSASWKHAGDRPKIHSTMAPPNLHRPRLDMAPATFLVASWPVVPPRVALGWPLPLKNHNNPKGCHRIWGRKAHRLA
jgi:hypothetical protein